jgi:GTP-binding protein
VKVQTVDFVRSAAGVKDLPRDSVPQVALVGRSNVGKSSLINALVGRTVARTSAAPGKTRLLNLYRVGFSSHARVETLYLVDLPGYGYARGGATAHGQFAALLNEYFALTQERARSRGEPGEAGRDGWHDRQRALRRPAVTRTESPLRGPSGPGAALLLVDGRHPGLPQDVAAWEWLRAHGVPCAVVATKMDKLNRGERARVENQWHHSLNMPVLPVSAETGEGLEDLWTLIVRLLQPHASESGTRATTRR